MAGAVKDDHSKERVVVQLFCFIARKTRCHPERSEAESRDLNPWVIEFSARSLHCVPLSLHFDRDDSIVSHFKVSRLDRYKKGKYLE